MSKLIFKDQWLNNKLEELKDLPDYVDLEIIEPEKQDHRELLYTNEGDKTQIRLLRELYDQLIDLIFKKQEELDDLYKQIEYGIDLERDIVKAHVLKDRIADLRVDAITLDKHIMCLSLKYLKK